VKLKADCHHHAIYKNECLSFTNKTVEVNRVQKACKEKMCVLFKYD